MNRVLVLNMTRSLLYIENSREDAEQRIRQHPGDTYHVFEGDFHSLIVNIDVTLSSAQG